MSYRSVVACSLALLASACAQWSPRVQAISTSRIQEVVDDVKRQVSIYVSFQNENYYPSGKPKFIRTDLNCGNGLIDFDITDVKVDLLTTLDKSGGGSLTLAAIPVGTPATVGGAIGASWENIDTQELVFSFSPEQNSAFKYNTEIDDKQAPLFLIMVSLREALINAAKVKNRICSTTGTATENTYKIALTFTEDLNGKINVGIAPITIGLSAEAKTTDVNTVTFTFKGHDFRPKWLRDKLAKEAKEQNKGKKGTKK